MAYEVELQASEQNVDTPLSQFPSSVDTFPKMMDVSLSLMRLVTEYNRLFQNGDLSGCNELLSRNVGLKDCFFNAEKYNQLRDAIIAMEYYLLEQVDLLYNTVSQNAIGIEDDPTEDEKHLVSYSAKKTQELVDGLQEQINTASNELDIAQQDIDNLENNTVYKSSVVNGLNSTSTTAPLAANQGKVLNEKITTISNDLNTAKSDIDKLESDVVYKSNVVNNLTNTSTNAPLAANQGKVLNDKVTNLTNTVNGKANSSHNHAAGNITAGTLSGKVVANASAVATLTNAQVRNIRMGTSAPSSLAAGEIFILY